LLKKTILVIFLTDHLMRFAFVLKNIFLAYEDNRHFM